MRNGFRGIDAVAVAFVLFVIGCFVALAGPYLIVGPS